MTRYPVNQSQQRLDIFLTKASGKSRKEIKRLLDQGLVFVNSKKIIIASWELNAKDIVEIKEINSKTSPKEQTQNYFLKILFEDDDLIVVEKEAGISCEKSPLDLKPTLPEIVEGYIQRKNPRFAHTKVFELHRLDKNTSGVMVYGKSKRCLKLLDDFKAHRIIRSYIALVEGAVKQQEGRISKPLLKTPWKKGKKMEVLQKASEGAKTAVTDFKTLERYEKKSLLQLNLHTGRTHQIRAHLADLGHPVVGDTVYGESKTTALRDFHALHAAELAFIHPVTGKKLSFKSKTPKRFKTLAAAVRKGELKY